MSARPTPDEDLQAAVDAVMKAGSVSGASIELGINLSTLRSRLKNASLRGIMPTKVEGPVDPTQTADATSTLVDGMGNVKLQWIKTKASMDRQREMLLEIVEESKKDIKQMRPRKINKANYNNKLMSVIPWGDPHFGLYCWAEEVGQDFDADIAQRDLCNAVRYLVSQSPTSERCVLVNLGDFYHSDNNMGTTTKGTRLDTDTRLARVVRIGVNAIRTAIETALEKHKTVEIVNAIGNHDEVLSLCMSILLAHVYEKEPRVIVHDKPTRRHYIRHGKVLIGVTHGDKQHEKELPGIMATEKPEDWGKTIYRYFYKGHYHHDKKTEYNGATVEMFRTLAPNDEYATSGGWLSMQDMKLICIHADYGEVSRLTCSLNMLRDLNN